ncbi:MAG: sortase B protein-sorting domain-containing protein [Ruminococcaceae bacterium]|nr:sortase B protein-sorting domain-containing protein [Oscillospiraceae bacterium]
MRRFLVTVLAVLLLLSVTGTAYADEIDQENGKVTYDGNSQRFIFEPGSGHSPNDLFPNFKEVMPGDTLTQKITVKNDASEKVKVKLYLRSLGADEDSKAFLSQLRLKVQKSNNNTMAYMFDAAASESAQLSDWVCLGVLYSGGEVNLDVLLEVPVELDSSFQNKIGYVNWEFMVEEFPVGPNDPKPPKTGDNSNLLLWTALLAGSGILFIILLPWRKKDKEEEKKSAQL